MKLFNRFKENRRSKIEDAKNSDEFKEIMHQVHLHGDGLTIIGDQKIKFELLQAIEEQGYKVRIFPKRSFGIGSQKIIINKK